MSRTVALDTPLEALGPTLESMIGVHERLIGLAGEHRRAIGSADGKVLDDVVVRTETALRELTELETERRRIAGACGVGASPKAEELAALMPEEEGERVRTLADRLRELVGRLRGEQAAVREASVALARHAQALIEQVAGSLSHAGTYSPGGRVEAGRSPIVTAMDVRS